MKSQKNILRQIYTNEFCSQICAWIFEMRVGIGSPLDKTKCLGVNESTISSAVRLCSTKRGYVKNYKMIHGTQHLQQLCEPLNRWTRPWPNRSGQCIKKIYVLTYTYANEHLGVCNNFLLRYFYLISIHNQFYCSYSYTQVHACTLRLEWGQGMIDFYEKIYF